VGALGGSLLLVHDGASPLEHASLQIGGGELVLANDGPDNPAHFDNPLRVTTDGTLTAGTGGLDVSGAPSVRLGSAGKTLTVDEATLTLRTTDGYGLEIAGAVSADGTVRVTEGRVTFAGGGEINSAVASGGQLDLDADLNVSQMTIKPGARVDTGANRLEVTGRLGLGSTKFTISEGHSFMAGGADLADQTEPRTLTLQGGVLSIAFPLEPSAPLRVLDSIGINFGSDWQALDIGEVAGAPSVAQAHWNNLAGATGEIAPLMNRSGVSPAGNPTVSWWGGRSFRIGTTGTPNERLFRGYLDGGSQPIVVILSDIPYDRYDAHAYIGSGYATDAGGSISTGTETSFFKGEGRREGEIVFVPVNPFAESIDDVPDGLHSNYAVFSGLSGDTTLTLTGLTAVPRVGLLGLQIVQSVWTDDADLSNTHLAVTADTRLDTRTVGAVTLGDLALEGGSTLTLAPSGAAGVRFRDLMGDGGVVGDVSVRGVLSPGDSVGTLNFTDLTMQAGSTYHWELGDSAADRVVAGELALPPGGWSLKLIDRGATTVDDELVLFTYIHLADDSLGTCTRIDADEVSHWSFADGGPRLYNDAENHRVLLTGVIAVPEPGTLLLLASGGLGIFMLRRRPKPAAR
jgi:hypothetical protein